MFDNLGFLESVPILFFWLQKPQVMIITFGVIALQKTTKNSIDNLFPFLKSVTNIELFTITNENKACT